MNELHDEPTWPIYNDPKNPVDDDMVSDSLVPVEQEPSVELVEVAGPSELARKMVRAAQIGELFDGNNDRTYRTIQNQIKGVSVRGDVLIYEIDSYDDTGGMYFYQSAGTADNLRVLEYARSGNYDRSEIKSAQELLPTIRRIGMNAYALFALAPPTVTAAVQAGPGALALSGVASAGIAVTNLVSTSRNRKKALIAERSSLVDDVVEQATADREEIKTQGVFVRRIGHTGWLDSLYDGLDKNQRYRWCRGESRYYEETAQVGTVIKRLIENDETPSEYWEMIKPLVVETAQLIERAHEARTLKDEQEMRRRMLTADSDKSSNLLRSIPAAAQVKRLNKQIGENIEAMVLEYERRDARKWKNWRLSSWSDDERQEVPANAGVAKELVVKHGRILVDSTEIKQHDFGRYLEYMQWVIGDYPKSGVAVRTYYKGLKEHLPAKFMPAFDEFQAALLSLPR